jgi:hypothetical protein
MGMTAAARMCAPDVEDADARSRFPTAEEDAMLRPGLLGLGLVVLCTACAPREPRVYNVERSRTYAQDRAAVWDGALRFLQANSITVVRADAATGVITAERRDYQDAGWAECNRRWVVDRSSEAQRRDRARPISRDLALEITVRESPAGTEVQPVAQFTELQNDRYRNWSFTQPCRSKGVLERALLDALGGARPPASPAPPEPRAPDEVSSSLSPGRLFSS